MLVLNVEKLKDSILSGEFDDIPVFVPVNADLALTTMQFLYMARDLFEHSEPPAVRAGVLETIDILIGAWEATERLFTDGGETVQ